jgi:hypothetical protein
MEDRNGKRSDEVKVDPKLVEELRSLADEMDYRIPRFTITGPGISGDVYSGFMFKPPGE